MKNLLTSVTDQPCCSVLHRLKVAYQVSRKTDQHAVDIIQSGHHHSNHQRLEHGVANLSLLMEQSKASRYCSLIVCPHHQISINEMPKFLTDVTGVPFVPYFHITYRFSFNVMILFNYVSLGFAMKNIGRPCRLGIEHGPTLVPGIPSCSHVIHCTTLFYYYFVLAYRHEACRH